MGTVIGITALAIEDRLIFVRRQGSSVVGRCEVVLENVEEDGSAHVLVMLVGKVR